jgi:bifunctional polynucleotide phosphatase/kinase
MIWRVVKDSLLVGRFNIAAQSATQGKRRIAAFDFDSTLITTASGKTFSRDASDWKWWDSSVPGRLKELHTDGFLVAIISNQGGISLKPDPKTVKSDQKRLADFKTKVTAVFNQLDFPISIYAATSRDQYRKPRTGMWNELIEDYDLENAESIDLENSVFVGDAGGREAVAGGVKDHSCVDRFVETPDHALAIKSNQVYAETLLLTSVYRSTRQKSISGMSIRDHSLGLSSRPPTRKSGLTAQHLHVSLISNLSYFPAFTCMLSLVAANTFTQPVNPEIVMFCGSPGSGKSSFYWKHLQPLGYGRVNQDILKTVSC